MINPIDVEEFVLQMRAHICRVYFHNKLRFKTEYLLLIVVFQPSHQFVADVVSNLAANILTPSLRHSDAGVLVANATHYSIDVTGVEIVASTDSAYRCNRLNIIRSAALGTVDTYRLRAVGQYQHRAIAAHAGIDVVAILQAKQVAEVLDRATHNVSQTHIFLDKRHHVRQIGYVVLAEIHIIIKKCASLASLLQKASDHRPQDRVDCKEGAEKHHVVSCYLRQPAIHRHRGVVFIEDVPRIVVLVQKRQRNMRLDVLVATDVFRRHAVFLQIAADDVADMVSTSLGHHCTRHASTSKRHNAVECRAAGNGLLRLVVLEDDVKHRLPYPYHASQSRNLPLGVCNLGPEARLSVFRFIHYLVYLGQRLHKKRICHTLTNSKFDAKLHFSPNTAKNIS